VLQNLQFMSSIYFEVCWKSSLLICQGFRIRLGTLPFTIIIDYWIPVFN
jgi:hypothetical protein